MEKLSEQQNMPVTDVAEDDEELRPEDNSPGISKGILWPLISIPVLILGGFAAFALLSKRSGTAALVLLGAAALLFTFLIIRILPGLFGFFKAPNKPTTGEKAGERSKLRLHPTVKLITGSVLIQLAVIYIVYAFSGLNGGFSGTVFADYQRLFIGSHGLEFGENTRSLISSLGLLSFALPEHAERFVAGSSLVLPVFLVNTVFVSACALLLYELVLLEFDKKSSMFASALLLLSPSVLLMLQPLSGTAPFIAFSLLSLYLLRKGNPLFAGFFAMICCVFNIFGALLFAPILIEGIRRAVRLKAEGKKCGGAVAECVIGTLLPVFAAAGGIVLLLTGFSGLGIFSSAERAVSVNAGLILPCAVVLLFIVLAVASLLRIRVSYAVYSVLYMALSSAVMPVSLSLFAVFAFPLLNMMETSVLSRRYLRTACCFLMAVLTLLFIYFLFVRR